jgi:outer membrane lipoprotein SlyB
MRRALLIAVLLLSGCASDQQVGIGSAASDANVATIKLGVVESVTPIEMDASSESGASIGSVFGQVGGGSSGGGRGSTVGSILGTVLGGTLGHQSGIATKPGLEIWVKLDGEEGKSTYVMQPGKPDAFKVGGRVRVVSKRGETRVEPEATAEVPKDAPPKNIPSKDTPKEPLKL